MDIHAGDILAVRGKGWLSRQILKATGNTVSHVGLLLDVAPSYEHSFVIEALARVKTRALEESIADCERAYILSPTNLTDAQRTEITLRGAQFSADDYGWGDIALQLGDAITRSTWFTRHLNWGLLETHPICSYLVAEAYEAVGLTFGKKPNESITPADIYSFARENPDKYVVAEIK